MAIDVMLTNQRGPVDTVNPMPVTVVGGGVGGGGGGGSSLTDTLLTDNAGVLFLARDNGTVLSYVRLDTGVAYTPSAPIKVAGAAGAATDANLTSIGSTNHADLVAVLNKMVTGAATDANLTSIGSTNHADLVALTARVSPYTPNVTFTGTNTAANGVGTATAIATDYIAVAANTARRAMSCSNTHVSATLIVNPAGVAYNGTSYVGIPVPPGGTYVWDGAVVPNAALHIASATAGATYFVTEG